MESVYYMQRGAERFGPYSWAQICQYAQSGHLAADDLLWSAELGNWTPAHRIDSLKPLLPRPTTRQKATSKNAWSLVVVLGAVGIVAMVGLAWLVWKPAAGPQIESYYPVEGAAGSAVAIELNRSAEMNDFRITFGDADLPIRTLTETAMAVTIPLNADSGELTVFWQDRRLESVPFTVLQPKTVVVHEQRLQPSSQFSRVLSDEGYGVTIPGGLLDAPRTLTIATVEHPSVLNDDPFTPVEVIDVSLEGMEQLSDFVEIGVPYDPTLLDPSLPATAQFNPARWDEENRVWVDLYFRVDEREHKVYFITDHLSYFLTGFSLLGLAKTGAIVAVVGGTLGEVAERWANDKYLSRNWKIRILYSDKALRAAFPDATWKQVIAPAKMRLTDNYDPKVSYAVQDIAHIFEESLSRYMDAGFPDPTKKGIWGAHIYTRYVKVKIDSLYNYYVQQGEMAHETFWDTIHIPTEIINLEFFQPAQTNPTNFESRFTFLKSGLAHELFHVMQRPYYGLSITLLETQHTWWREATAEWAGHDLARIPYRAGWDKDPPVLVSRLAHGFLSQPINARGKISNTTTETGGLEHEYLESVFVRYLVREAHLSIKDLVVHVAKSGRKIDPLVPLRTFVKSKTGKSFDRLVGDYAAWLLSSSRLRLSDYDNPTNTKVVAAVKDTVLIEEEEATLRLSQKTVPAAEQVWVFKSHLGEEVLRDPDKPFAILDQPAPAYVEVAVEDGDVLYFLCANGTATDRRVNLDIQRKNKPKPGEGEAWSRAASATLDLGADGTALVWAVRVSTGTVRIEPPQIDDAVGYREYPFQVTVEGLAQSVSEVEVQYDFGDRRKDSNGSETVPVQGGKASLTLKHEYLPSPSIDPDDQPLTHVLTVDVQHGGESLGQAEARVTVEQAEVSIQPPRVLVLELAPGAAETTETFVALAKPQAAWRFDWSFDDGGSFSDANKNDGRSEVQHTYSGLAPGHTYHPEVRLFGPEGELLAVDRITVNAVAPGGTGKLVLVDRKVESKKFGMIGAEPGDEYWNVGTDSATVHFQYKESGGPPEKKWERTITTRFRYQWGLMPRTIAPDQTLEFRLRIEDIGCSVSYSKGSHALKKEIHPHLNKTQRAVIAVHSGNESIQFSGKSIGTLYEVGEGPADPVEDTWLYSTYGPDRYHEGDVRKIIITLKQFLTETKITYTYRYSEH